MNRDEAILKMTQASRFTFDFAAATDIGCKRSNNEDSFGYDANQQIYVVCDGMGGGAAGEVASALAVRTLIESFDSTAINPTPGSESFPVEERLMASILEANRVVWKAGSEDPELRTMGTTLVCACLDQERMIIGNVGDSRAYLLRGSDCIQITLDHSLLEEQMRLSNITPEQAAASGLQSVITRAVGVVEDVEPDLFAVALQMDDLLLLASDGLTRYVQTQDIAALILSGSDVAAICNSLIEHAKEQGGADNITCILLKVVDASSATPGD